MGLRERVLRAATGAPTVLVLAAPGAEVAAWRAAGALRRLGWTEVGTPAGAQVLVVVGEVPSGLADDVERLWGQVTAPRHRLDLDGGTGPATLHRLADDAVRHLRDAGGPASGGGEPAPAGHGGVQHDMGGHAGHETGGHGGHETGGHGGHETGGHGHHHDMGEVAGLPMASTGADRDGLELDHLRVRLGPFLPGWPAGLVLEVTLSGDVVVTASATAAAAFRDGTAAPPAAVLAERLRAVLHVAGWPAAATALRDVRDALLDGTAVDPAGRRWLRRVGRSRTLAWSLRDVPGPGGTDLADTVRDWCARLLDGDGEAGVRPPVRSTGVADLPALVTGRDLGEARLLVAGAVDPLAATAPAARA